MSKLYSKNKYLFIQFVHDFKFHHTSQRDYLISLQTSSHNVNRFKTVRGLCQVNASSTSRSGTSTMYRPVSCIVFQRPREKKELHLIRQI